jgi:hypothetical protein
MNKNDSGTMLFYYTLVAEMSWFYYKILLVSLGITLGLFLAFQGYKYFVRTVRKNEVYVPKIILHYVEHFVSKGEIMFHFEIREEQPILLELCNTNLENILTLKNETMTSGSYTVKFDTTTVSNGEYFYCLKGENQRLMKKFEIKN